MELLNNTFTFYDVEALQCLYAQLLCFSSWKRREAGLVIVSWQYGTWLRI